MMKINIFMYEEVDGNIEYCNLIMVLFMILFLIYYMLYRNENKLDMCM